MEWLPAEQVLTSTAVLKRIDCKTITLEELKVGVLQLQYRIIGVCFEGAITNFEVAITIYIEVQS